MRHDAPVTSAQNKTMLASRRFQLVLTASVAALVPFLLQGVGGRLWLNQPDGIHPTAEGQRIMAETVWKVLEPVLRKAGKVGVVSP